MKAFVVAKYAKDGLRVAEMPEPNVGNHDVLIKVVAASINPLDKMVRNGEFKQLLKYKLPFTLGHDVSGIITKVGSNVAEFKVGDEVYSRPRDLHIGAFAEYIAINEDDIALKPINLTFHEAAAVPLVSLASWQALVERAHIKPGDKILIHAGAGGLGSTAIQLGRHLGAEVATTVSTQNIEFAKKLGASIVIDYTNEDFTTKLAGYDFVWDSLGGSNLEKSLSVVKPGGLVISVVGPPDSSFAKQLGAPAPIGMYMKLLSHKIRKQAKAHNVRYEFMFMQANGAQLRKLKMLYENDILRPVIDRIFAFDKTLDAIEYVEKRKVKSGKVVVQVAPEN
jgi:NADPH:quinone reductase-like Zn-dependent oxidoreductase